MRRALSDFEQTQAEAIVEYLEAHGAFTPAERPADEHHSLKPGLNTEKWYAIHDNDLEALKWASTVVALAISCVAVVGSLGVTPAILFLFGIGHNYRENRVELTAEQGRVLLVLKQSQNVGRTIEALVDEAKLTEDVLTQALTDMLDIARKNNALTALVREQNGTWYSLV